MFTISSLVVAAENAHVRQMRTTLLPAFRNIVRRVVSECALDADGVNTASYGVSAGLPPKTVDPAMRVARLTLDDVVKILYAEGIWFEVQGNPRFAAEEGQGSVLDLDRQRLLHPIPFVPETIAHLPPTSLEVLRTVWREACTPLYHCICSICKRAAETAAARGNHAETMATAASKQQGNTTDTALPDAWIEVLHHAFEALTSRCKVCKTRKESQAVARHARATRKESQVVERLASETTQGEIFFSHYLGPGVTKGHLVNVIYTRFVSPVLFRDCREVWSWVERQPGGSSKLYLYTHAMVEYSVELLLVVLRLMLATLYFRERVVEVLEVFCYFWLDAPWDALQDHLAPGTLGHLESNGLAWK
ncbi:hypothetical protein B0H10DRAFT_2355050 [Mycena sp. CBHHK59/15]|nr:hypothetical protein B0H10DRAFT_2355050 [Mycena sp. CBHHK59/15]